MRNKPSQSTKKSKTKLALIPLALTLALTSGCNINRRTIYYDSGYNGPASYQIQRNRPCYNEGYYYGGRGYYGGNRFFSTPNTRYYSDNIGNNIGYRFTNPISSHPSRQNHSHSPKIKNQKQS